MHRKGKGPPQDMDYLPIGRLILKRRIKPSDDVVFEVDNHARGFLLT